MVASYAILGLPTLTIWNRLDLKFIKKTKKLNLYFFFSQLSFLPVAPPAIEAVL